MKRFYIFFVILFFFSSLMHVANAQNEADWMPDANLRTAVREALNLNADDTLTTQKMLDLTALTATDKGITDITGLEYATNLTSLEIWRNQISDLTPLEALTRLTRLTLGRNQISDLSPLESLTRLTHLGLFHNQITDISSLTGLVNLRWLKISENPLTNAHLLANLPNLTEVDIQIPDPPDTQAPGVSIAVPSGVQTGAFSVTITFTESVSGFTQSDLSLSGTATASITGWTTTIDTTYTATITPTSSGDVVLNIAAGVATDTANNPNAAATAKTVTVSVDVDKPSVSLSVPSGVQNGAFNVRISFSEAVSGFENTDLSLVGSTATATISQLWTSNLRRTVYTLTITPTSSGSVILNFPAGVVTDLATNPNTAATEKTVTVDVDRPGVSIAVPSSEQTGAFDATITFTESVSGFVQSELSLGPNTAGATISSWHASQDKTTYTATITPTTSGQVTLGVPASVATDAVNNPNTAAQTQTVTIEIPDPTPDPATWMPDANLREAVRTTLNLGAEEILTKEEMQDLTSLTAADKGITDITGLEYATNLTSLEIWRNQISDLTPLEALTSLTRLTLGRNQISDLSPLESLTRLTHLGLFHNEITDVSPLTKLVNLEWLRLADNELTNAHLLSSLTRLTDVDITIPDRDTEAPGVSIAVPSGVQTRAFDVTITFTESVSGFVQSELSLSGTASASITGWTSNTGNTTYTATITPTSSGDVVLNIAADAATDAANNPNTAATAKTVTVSVDVNTPRVSLSVPSGVQNGAFNVRISFSETVSGFENTDLSLVGSTATATISQLWTSNLRRTVYTLTITPTSSGSVILNFPAGVVTDLATNPNTAATEKTVTVDVDRPGVSIAVPSSEQTGAFDATITFTEAVSDFEQADLSLSGTATASITEWTVTGSTTYTATITPTTSGQVTLGVSASVATDAANNPNTAAQTQTVTIEIPDPIPNPATWMPDANLRAAVRNALNLGTGETLTKEKMRDLTALTATNLGITDITGLEYATNITSLVIWRNSISDLAPLGDLTRLTHFKIGNNDITDISALARLTQLTTLGLQRNNITNISPLSKLVNLEWLRLAENPVTDFSPLSNLPHLTDVDVNIPSDTERPGVSLSVPSGVQNGRFDVTITFTEAVSGFVKSDVSLTGTATATITAWDTTDDITYTATVTPTSSGQVTLSIAESVATDAANNQNTAATAKTVTVTVDVDAPRVSLSVPSGVQKGAFDVRISFSKTVSGFENTDLSLVGSTATATISRIWTSNLRRTVYTLTITPTSSGIVTLNFPAGVVTDLANNPNTAAQTQTVSVDVGPVDVDRPGVSLSVPSPARGAFNLIITFTEPVSGFVQSDLSIAPITTQLRIHSWSASQDRTTYTALITPTISHQATFSVPANVATDAEGNNNTASASLTVHMAVDPPWVSLSVPSGVQTGRFDVTIRFTEPVSGFVQSDLSLKDSTANASIIWWYTADNRIYTAGITPTTSGQVTIRVPTGVATDAEGNGNVGSVSRTVTVDVDRPGVSLSAPSPVNGAFDVIITFTEAVSGFVQSELSLSGTATATATAWATTDNTVYTATITPTTSGTVTLSVSANVATDGAGNNNTAARSQTVTIEIPEATWMPDANLRAAVREALGFANDEVLTQASMQNLTTLNAPQEEISNLTGLEHATQLTTLVAWGNSISDLTPLGDLTRLTHFKIGNNDITDISALAKLTKLRTLGLHKNNITNISTLAKLVNLEWLRLAENPITDFSPLSNLPHLTDVDVNIPSDTERPGVSLSVPSGVQNGRFDVTITFTETVSGFVQSELLLSGTATATVTVWATTDNTVYTATITPTTNGTVTLNIAQGVATDLANNPNTAAIAQTATIDIPDTATWMPDAQLRAAVRESLGLAAGDALTQADMAELQELEAPRRQITNLTGLEHATQLTKLVAWRNSISDLSPLAGLTNLQSLNLVDNSISDLSPLAGLTNLQTLYLGDNGIRDLSHLAGLTNLQSLNLVDNMISDLSPLAGLTNLGHLSLSFNIGIRNISPLAGLTNLQSLYLGVNDIRNISPLAGLTNLQLLQLSRNSIIDTSPLAGLTNLQLLQLSENDIIDISPLAGLTNLQTLSLSENGIYGNRIIDISPLAELTNLQSLNLNFNNIIDISPLAELTNLQTLSLGRNSIIDILPLAGLTNLAYLTLWDNLILDTSPLYPLLTSNGGSLVSVDIWVSQYPPWDVNEDGVVDATDSALVTAALGQSGNNIVDPRTDVNGDRTVDAADLLLVIENLDNANPLAPAGTGISTLLDRETLKTLDPATLEAQLEILRAESDGSLKYLRAIALLESILAAMRPDETRLLANYPNPFNPETWIPYQLTNPSNVQISIYDVRGTVVRRLELGHQRAGYYTSRSRAAYWDGRNGLGERVASGIYFYQLQADNMSLLRKMLILK